MSNTGSDILFRLYTRADAERIVEMINRDSFHMLHGVTVEQFEQDLDEPGERIRENTFVVEVEQNIVGYFSLCFVDQETYYAVYCYGSVDTKWRRQMIGTEIFTRIFSRLEKIARQEGKAIHFIHRALTCIPGETNLGVNFRMQEQNRMEILCLKDMGDLKAFNLLTGFQFRAPKIEDATGWADIYNDSFGGNKSVDSVVHEFNGTTFSQNLYILCISDSGDPVGIISSFLRGTHARIPTIAVKSEWQGKGIGKALLSKVLSRLRIYGASDVSLSVGSKNSIAKSLYSNFGFKEEYKRIHYTAKFLP